MTISPLIVQCIAKVAQFDGGWLLWGEGGFNQFRSHASGAWRYEVKEGTANQTLKGLWDKEEGDHL